MITPPKLQKGDTIGIVSTARKISRKELIPSLRFLDDLGLKARLGNTIGAADDQFAGTDEIRAKDFQQMMDDPNIKAIWCARGGYGTVRIIDFLDFTKFQKTPKWVIGFSDVTVLHSHLNTLGIQSIHAQMPLEMDHKTEATRVSLTEALFRDLHEISFDSNCTLNRMGNAKGQLIGGNLSILYSLCGSASAIDTDGKILFIEDLDEYLYHIDRMLQNLKRNGLFENLAGLIVGGMSDMNDNAIPFGKTAEEIILDTVSDNTFPVCFDFPAGHIADNRALIFGREVQLEILEKRVRLSF